MELFADVVPKVSQGLLIIHLLDSREFQADVHWRIQTVQQTGRVQKHKIPSHNKGLYDTGRRLCKG